MLLSYKTLRLEAQHESTRISCVVDISSHRYCITIIDSADEPEEYTGPQQRSHSFVSAYFMHCLILPASLSSCSSLRLQVMFKLMFKLEFENACGAHIEATMNSISIYYLFHLEYLLCRSSWVGNKQ